MNYHMEDFTEENYRRLIQLAKQKYRFHFFEDYRTIKHGVLWRHDIDVSVHRAYALAKIEYEAGVQSTFFVHLHNSFYNALEKEVAILLRKITALGHSIGLHFEPGFYDVPFGDRNALEQFLEIDRVILQQLIGQKIDVFSFHNPDVGGNWHQLKIDCICGMISAYSPTITDHFKYCSDSNGYWRFDRLEDVLQGAAYPRLHVLTHPEWWQQDVLPPRSRIERCALHRSQRVMEHYDNAFTADRINISAMDDSLL